MTPDAGTPRSDPDDSHLDDLIRAVLKGASDSGARVDEVTILAYLAGTASEEEAARVQAMLTRSAELRREVLEIAGELDGLESAETRTAFEQAPSPAIPDRDGFLGIHERSGESIWQRLASALGRRRDPDGISFLDSLRGLAIKPAFAYVATFLLMAYPTYRFFTDPRTPSPVVEPGRGAIVRPESVRLQPHMTLRGEEPIEIEQVVRPPSGALLDLMLPSSVAPSDQFRIRLDIDGPEGLHWHEAEFAGLMGEDDATHYRLLLDSDALPDGTFHIRFTRYLLTTSEEIHTEEFRFRLSSDAQITRD